MVEARSVNVNNTHTDTGEDRYNFVVKSMADVIIHLYSCVFPLQQYLKYKDIYRYEQFSYTTRYHVGTCVCVFFPFILDLPYDIGTCRKMKVLVARQRYLSHDKGTCRTTKVLVAN